MIKNIFKVALAALLCVGGMSVTSCSKSDTEDFEKNITLNDLPETAQSFLKEFFAGNQIEKIERQVIGSVIMYEVDLKSGFEIMFDSKGVWQEVSAPSNKSIPSGIAPALVESYVMVNYPDYGINEINKTGSGYNVELTGNGPELEFDAEGNFVRVISDF